MRIHPVPWFTMFSRRPLRSELGVITPRYSSGASIATAPGSCSVPPISRVTTCGLPTVSSNPSRHHLDQDRELKLAAALDLPTVGAVAVEDADDTLPMTS